MTVAAPGDGSSPRPLPFRPRPVTGESTGSYVRRLARANHLRPAYLRRYLASPKDGTIRIELLAAMAGRSLTALEHALADMGPQQGTLPPRGRAPAQTGSRAGPRSSPPSAATPPKAACPIALWPTATAFTAGQYCKPCNRRSPPRASRCRRASPGSSPSRT